MGVIITYKGATISNLTASGQKTLLTSGKYCEANIGINYTAGTDITPVKDGITRLYLEIPSECDLTKLSIPLYWNQSVTNGVEIDWGDNSATETVSGTGNVNATPHTYSTGGLYTVKMTVADGCDVKLGNGSAATGILGATSQDATTYYRSVLKAIETGSGVRTIQAYCFCRSALQTVIFGDDVTAFGNYAMVFSYSLGSMHFLGALPANSNISNTTPFGYIPPWCKIYVPPAYFDGQGNPQNIPSRLPSTSTYTYAEEPNA